MTLLTIYGASDDLVEVEVNGTVTEEFDAYQATRLRLIAPGGQGELDVVVEFNKENSELDWSIAVEALVDYPAWPIFFTERPGYEGDPAVSIQVPEGTQVRLVVAGTVLDD